MYCTLCGLATCTSCPYFSANSLTQRDWLPASIATDRKSTRLNSSHLGISYAVFCLKKKKQHIKPCGSIMEDVPRGDAQIRHPETGKVGPVALCHPLRAMFGAWMLFYLFFFF